MRPTAAAGLANLSSYQARWLRQDIVAGLVLTALLVPQGMAYAELAGLPPITRTFRDQIRAITASEPRPSWIVAAAEPLTDVDTTAADMLEELDEDLNARGISLVFAEMKDPVRAKIDRYELTKTIDPDHFFPTITQAVKAFQRQTGAEWQPPSAEPSCEAASHRAGGSRGAPPGVGAPVEQSSIRRSSKTLTATSS
jgi:MFS superfamily sulfate permease-like transporter